MTKKSKHKFEPIIDKGLLVDTAALRRRADTIIIQIVALYGRIQALQIAEMVYQDVEKMQDQPTELEKRIIAEEKQKRVDKLTRKLDIVRKRLEKFENKS